VQSLTALGLVDEYQLLVHPVLLGGGKRLFGDGGERTDLSLVATRTFSTGVVQLTYQLAEGQKDA
jgi:dihydrofolate reductase